MARRQAELREQLQAVEERSAQIQVQQAMAADEQKARLAKRIGDKILKGSLRQVFTAWQQDVKNTIAMRERVALAETRALLLSRQAEAKLELVRRVFAATLDRLVAATFHAWHHLVTQDAKTRVVRAESRIEELERELAAAGGGQAAIEAAEAVKERLAAKLGAERSGNRRLMLVLQAWRREASEAAGERRRGDEAHSLAAEAAEIERKREAEKERRATAHAARFLVGARDRCFIAWRGWYVSAKLDRAAASAAEREQEMRSRHDAEREAEEDRRASQMSNVLERMNRDRLLQLCGKILSAWRRLVVRDKQASAGGVHAKQTAQSLAEKESLSGQLRLANAAREAEARRADMVRSEARLEAQARVAQLETAVRRAELDAQDAQRNAELRVEEMRKGEARQAQLKLQELQSQLRLERLEAERKTAAMKAELEAAQAAQAKELDLLRKELAEMSELRREVETLRLERDHAQRLGSQQSLAEQNAQLKQITSLQLQLSELQRELQLAGGGGGSGASGGFSGAFSGGDRSSAGGANRGQDGGGGGGGGGGGFWEGLFGGAPSPEALSRRSARSPGQAWGDA